MTKTQKQKAEEQRKAYYDDPLALPPECDDLCRFRPCYNKYENKGSFTPGTGYTDYYDDFTPVCSTRMSQGCPPTRNAPGDKANHIKALLWAAETLIAYRTTRSTVGIKLRKRAETLTIQIKTNFQKKHS